MEAVALFYKVYYIRLKKLSRREIRRNDASFLYKQTKEEVKAVDK